MMNQFKTQLLIFGEVLFDQFTNDERVLGGAPFNVAWHLQGFGLNPLFISRIAKDQRGDDILTAMSSWGMSQKGIQLDDNHPTGTVDIVIKNSQPEFTINDNQAYDYIEADLFKLSCPASLHEPILYHGSLAQRNLVSRNSFESIALSSHAKRFVDVNLRSPWYSIDEVKSLVAQANWLKLNEDEFSLLLNQKFQDDANLEECLINYFKNNQFNFIVLTRAEKGAFLISKKTCLKAKAPQVNSFIDAVGAGDGFSAITLVGILQGWDEESILHNALNFAAELCAHQGAIIKDRGIYEINRLSWQVETA